MHDLPDDTSWMTPYRRRIGDRLRAERHHQNLRQQHVYLQANVDRKTLQAIEGGRGNPTLEVLLRLTYVLGMPIEDLFTEQPPSPEGRGRPDSEA
ncbi:helix-turn-helix transcriptional regulator [Streptomyces sp. NPDC048242]|uniref:helix-turn-helix domain-containing protein n=1 Tax=Streptomyces sp. NPDC048242 TaxID=3155026 RepID=UPI0034160C0A